jgi:GT2 family glycosyltransferase
MASFPGIVADWLFNGIAGPRWLRNSQFAWRISSPSTGPLTVSGKALFIRGQIRASEATASSIAEISAWRRGKKTFAGAIALSSEPGVSDFSIRFTSGSGLKLYRISAHLTDGSSVLLGWRLFWCRPVAEYVRPSLALLSSIPEPEQIALPATPTPEVSIVIPIFNQIDLTLKCLKALTLHTPEISYEVILVDDCSTDPSADRLNRVPNLRLIRNATNQGFVRNCNRGAAAASGKFLVFLNNDTEVQPGWLAQLLKTFASRKDAGLVGAKLLYPSGLLQEAGGIIWNDGSGWNYGKNDQPGRPEYNYLKEADYCSGACIAIPREFFDQIGRFNLRYVPAYYEDTDLAFQVRAHGRKVYLQPASIVVHHEGVSSGTSTTSGVKQHQVTNAVKFREAWREQLASDQLPPADDFFHARDRSRDRPCVLVIDHTVPHFDRDAGSRSVFQYLQLLVAAGANVKFISDRFEADPVYAAHIESLGIETLCGPEFDLAGVHAWIIQHGAHIDYVLLSRPHVAERYLSVLRRHTKARILYLGHDIHHLREQMEDTLSPIAMPGWQKTQQLETGIWKSVDAVYYYTDEECEQVAAHCSTPARCIPLFMLPERPETPHAASEKTNGLLFVAGFAHQPNRDALTWFLSEIFPRVQAVVPGVSLDICGSSIPSELKNLASSSIRFHANISDAELDNAYQRARVCVVPLRFGAGMKGKVLEALFREKALVTTSVGAQGLVNAVGCFRIHDDAASFAEAVIDYYQNADARKKSAALTHDYVQQRFSERAALAVLSQDMDLRPKSTRNQTPVQLAGQPS